MSQIQANQTGSVMLRHVAGCEINLSVRSQLTFVTSLLFQGSWQGSIRAGDCLWLLQVNHITCTVSHITCTVSYITCTLSHITSTLNHTASSFKQSMVLVGFFFGGGVLITLSKEWPHVTKIAVYVCMCVCVCVHSFYNGCMQAVFAVSAVCLCPYLLITAFFLWFDNSKKGTLSVGFSAFFILHSCWV